MASWKSILISKKYVKPSSPTPPSLRKLKLSVWDQIIDNIYVSLVYFYSQCPHNISSLLEETLSKLLVHYYPFAGRLTADSGTLDCNDEGVEFSEAKIACRMSDILAADTMKEQDVLHPSCRFRYVHDLEAPMLIVHITRFECGGMAVSLTFKHKVADMHTFSRFTNCWAAMVMHEKKPQLPLVPPCPLFLGASIFPPRDDVSFSGFEDGTEQSTVTKLFVFDGEKLTKLKADSGVERASSFEVVTALLYKCAMSAEAKTASSCNTFRPSSLCTAVNLRNLLAVKDIQHYTGNLLSCFTVFTNHEADTEYSKLVSEIKRRKTELSERCRGVSYVTADWASDLFKETQERLKLARGKDLVGYESTSWRNFQMYAADFGWGKPVCVNIAHYPYRNCFVLMDREEEDMVGIRAWVILDEQVMSVFQNDPQLLAAVSC